MTEGEGRPDADFRSTDLLVVSRYERMRDHINSRSSGMRPLEREQLRKLGHIFMLAQELTYNSKLNAGIIVYPVGEGKPLGEVTMLPLTPVETEDWIDLLGRIAQGINLAYFKSKESQVVVNQVAAFAKSVYG